MVIGMGTNTAIYIVNGDLSEFKDLINTHENFWDDTELHDTAKEVSCISGRRSFVWGYLLPIHSDGVQGKVDDFIKRLETDLSDIENVILKHNDEPLDVSDIDDIKLLLSQTIKGLRTVEVPFENKFVLITSS